MTIDELIKQSHETAVNSGFYDRDVDINDPDKNASRLMLMVSELSEALEDIRNGKWETWYDDNGKPHGLPIELADLAIRLGDYCGWRGLDLEYAIEIKAAYNKQRPYMHGKAI